MTVGRRDKSGGTIQASVDDACALTLRQCSPLALCLIECLDDAHEHSPSAAQHLSEALALLGNMTPKAAAVSAGRGQPANVIASYLNFLIPEIGMRSHPAARLVRKAVQQLKGVEARRPIVRYH